MDDQNMNVESRAGFFSKSYLKHTAAFFGLILLVGGGYFIWNGYFSPEAKYVRGIEKSMAELPGKIEAYKMAMEADTYGGKTPEETLAMFISALQKGDIELASKYFVLDDDTAMPDAAWIEGLKKAKNEDRLESLADTLSRAKPGSSFMKGYYGFEVLNSEGVVDIFIGMQFNEFSKVWKIESL